MPTGYALILKDKEGKPLIRVPVVPVDATTGVEGTAVETDTFGYVSFTGLADSIYGFRTHKLPLGDATVFVVNVVHSHTGDDEGGTISGGGGGVTDHGALTGLADDDHPQYETSAEAAAKITAHEALANPHSVYATDTDLSAHAAGPHVSDHGFLAGLADDDHPQYAHDTDLSAHAALATHHAQAHVLATGTALGPDHTISGAVAGEVLRASSATAAAFDQLNFTDLGGTISSAQHGSIASGNLHPEYETPAEVDARIATHAATPHGGGSDIATHEAASNPHPTYETSVEAAAKVTAHEAAGDPHTQYVAVAGDTMTGDLFLAATNDTSDRHITWGVSGDDRVAMGYGGSSFGRGQSFINAVAGTASEARLKLLTNGTLAMTIDNNQTTAFSTGVTAVPAVSITNTNATAGHALAVTSTGTGSGTTVLKVQNDGLVVRGDKAVIIGAASLGLVGFYGVTPVVRPAAPTAAPAGGAGIAAGGWSSAANRDTAIAAINGIRTALINVGIMS